jgi:hypothetical protein
MGIAGKILAIANVIAAIVFIGVAALDYGQRQSWTFAVKEQDLLINGLPVDATEKDADGNPLVDSISERVQKDFLGRTGIKSQDEELTDRRKQLDAAAGDDVAKLQQVLIPLAQTAGQRDAWRQITDPAKLREILNEQFTLASGPVGERRQAIARLLFATSQSPEDLNRTLAVVGLSAFAHAANTQAANLQSMVPVYETAIDNDRTEFAVKHKALVQQIQTLAERVQDMQDTLKKQTEVKERHTALLKRRQEVVADLQQTIANTQKAAEAALAQQSKTEAETFAAQQAVTTTEQRNQELERTLRGLELNR